MKWYSFAILLAGLMIFGGCAEANKDSVYDVILEEGVEDPILLQYIFDYTANDENLWSGDGFTLLLSNSDKTILIDTPYEENPNAQEGVMFDNMSILGIEPTTIDTVFLSHQHGNKRMADLLERNSELSIYSLADDTVEFFAEKTKTEFNVVSDFMNISGPIYSTGEMKGFRGGDPVNEQGLIIETDSGLILISSCGHPDILNMIDRANENFDDKVVNTVIGGVHMKDETDPNVLEAVTSSMEEKGVVCFISSHCSGELFCDYVSENSDMDYHKGTAGMQIYIK